ncbi:hypothetical protein FB451DRAFT_1057523 [Mycena latifolia]|nr:hypothetical protein FB451DRAFT_1057523 [Mycena latifolia]
MSSSPPAKRQRLELEITRSRMWHPDGSVILQAGNTQFRVHWSVLSRHSSFFRGMQGLPQPLDQPSVEGCPVVELSDRVEDVENVLETLYNPLFLAQQTISLPLIASHVRLGRKYDFSDILQSVVERLAYENPITLEAYDALRTGSGSYSPTRVAGGGRSHYLDTVTLARENNLLSVLPCAYYRTLQITSPIFDGISRRAGTRTTLSPTDQRLCSLGRAALLKAQWDTGYTFGWLQDGEEEGCNDPFACSREKLSFLHQRIVAAQVIPLLPVSCLDRLGLCAACMEGAKTKMAAGRQKMWESLPMFFELPSWAELKNDL